ncbi:MAG: terminase family protein [Alphaproteobacteria bacterium]|nr:terminase family protein [Alphaproteobacteria bacterium]
MLAGRGYGKTRAGAEWVRMIAESDGNARIALIAATQAEARAIMVEGESGLLAVAPRNNRPRFESTRSRLIWRNGAQAFLYSAEAAEALRGPEHSHAWCDELAKWNYGQILWDNLQMGLRLGEWPRIMITTTPRPIPLLRSILASPQVVVTHGTTMDNPFLPEAFREAMALSYAGTRLGRQELNGELLTNPIGALWTLDMIECHRVKVIPTGIVRTVVAVDPPAGIGRDACGIIVAAQCDDGHAYVLEDATVTGASPEGWARAVRRCVEHYNPDRLIAESNQGGEMIASVLRAAGVAQPTRLIHARHGKTARAEPVAALYEQGRVHHIGSFPALEDQLCGMVIGEAYAGPGRSPDRADACIYALTELMLGQPNPVLRARTL